MTDTSSIYLTEHQLVAPLGGDSISLAKSALISTSAVSSANAPTTNLLELEVYDHTSPNVLINGDFSTGDYTGWTNNGTTIVTGDLPGKMYMVNVLNLTNVTQTVTGFDNKNVVVTVWHFGAPVIVSLELDDNSNILKSSSNKIFTQSDVWTKYSLGFYGATTGGTKAKITFSSVDDNAYIANVKMLKLDNYVSMNVGDAYLDNRNAVSISGQKLFVSDGSQIASSRPEMLDIRGDGFISGSLNVNGTVSANIIYPQISLQTFSTNIIVSSGNSTNISWSSGILEFLSTQSFGIASGSQTISTLTYFFLDSDVSSTVLQSSTLYTDVLGNRRVLIFSATPSSSGGLATWTSFSGQNTVATQLSDVSNSMGALTITNLLTMKDSLAAITIGDTGTLPTSSTLGSGLWIDKSGVYSLLSNVQQTTLTSTGLTAGSGSVGMDSTGITILIPNSFTSSRYSLKFAGTLGGTPGLGLTSWFSIPSRTLNSSLFSGYDIYSGTGFCKNSALQILSNANLYGGVYGATSIELSSGHNGTALSTIYIVSNADLTTGYININSQQTTTSVTIYGTGSPLFITDPVNNSVGMGGTISPNPNAVLDIDSTTKAFMPPRMTTTQRNAIPSPTAGMLIYNSTTNKLNIYTTTWEQVTSV